MALERSASAGPFANLQNVTVGRTHFVHPSELFYLRMLLTHVTGEELYRTMGGMDALKQGYESFEAACAARGLRVSACAAVLSRPRARLSFQTAYCQDCRVLMHTS